MISIETMDGQLVKVIQNISNEKFGFHQLFGFIGLDKANKREETRKRQGYDFTNSQWKFNFEFKTNKSGWSIVNAKDCEVSQVSEHIWSLETPIGTFKVTDTAHSQAPITLTDHEDSNSWMTGMLE